jgi:tetratricopeptide (TPR) repeat protein
MKRIILLLCFVTPLSLFGQEPGEINTLLTYRRFETAELKAQALLESDKGNPVYWYWLSQVYSNSKDSSALVKLQPPVTDNPWVRLASANILLAKGDVTRARQLFDEALGNRRKKDQDILIAAARANTYAANGDRNYAVELLKHAIKKDRDNPELHTMLGDAWFRLRDGSAAYSAYQEALKANSAYAPALFQLGKIFATQNNTDLCIKYYSDAVQADPSFAPAWYELYYYAYKTDAGKAYDYFTKYLSVADQKPSDQYLLVDLLYLTHQYSQAIEKATRLLSLPDINNRINKLMGYTYKAIDQPEEAISYMSAYFSNGPDTAFLFKDYDLVGDIYRKWGKQDSAVAWYLRALPMAKDSAVMVNYYRTLADYYKQKKDYSNQAEWAAKYYKYSSKATNVDLFNWGLSLYQAADYRNADSVFAVYSEKYPDHVFGPYWRARTNAAIDSAMTMGLAIPYYQQMIVLAERDTSNATNKKYLAEAYGYIATYVANEKKDYSAAIDYFEKLLEVDPANSDARRYIDILEKASSKENK